MRSFVVTMSLMFVAFSGFSEDAALMSRVTSGGMTPPEMSGWSSGITLFESGRVITSYCPNYATPCMTEELAILSSKVMERIRKLAGEVSTGELKFNDSPQCTDLPTTSYRIMINGKDFIFAANARCQIGLLEDYPYADSLKTLLDNLGSLESIGY